uniref:Pentatricopeptide repeat-containing protein n=1 Tax=Populus trichocarpa TaxID=3694 RepID=A0A2K1R697_POPTR
MDGGNGLTDPTHGKKKCMMATQLFLEMELSNSGNYVISSKICANMRRWDDSAKMRVLMKQCGVSKTLLITLFEFSC